MISGDLAVGLLQAPSFLLQAKELLTNYQTGVLENSPKMVLLFHLIEESVKLGDKILVFSQSLSTLALIEEFLGKREVPCLPGAEGQGVQKWVRNVSYFREFFAALFLEPWHGLLKVFFSFSLFFSSTPFSLKCTGTAVISQGAGRY